MTEDPTMYTCRCGYQTTDFGQVEAHLAVHEPSRMTTIAAIDGGSAGIEVRSTPHGDTHGAVEIGTIARERRDGSYHHVSVLVDRRSIPFLIEQLEAHRLGEAADPCPACAAQALVARLAAAAMRTAHTCPDLAKKVDR